MPHSKECPGSTLETRQVPLPSSDHQTLMMAARPSTAQVAVQAQVLTEQAAMIEALRAEAVALKRQLGRDRRTRRCRRARTIGRRRPRPKVKAPQRTVAEKNVGRREQGGSPVIKDPAWPG
jgi:hypothetical protein